MAAEANLVQAGGSMQRQVVHLSEKESDLQLESGLQWDSELQLESLLQRKSESRSLGNSLGEARAAKLDYSAQIESDAELNDDGDDDSDCDACGGDERRLSFDSYTIERLEATGTRSRAGRAERAEGAAERAPPPPPPKGPVANYWNYKRWHYKQTGIKSRPVKLICHPVENIEHRILLTYLLGFAFKLVAILTGPILVGLFQLLLVPSCLIRRAISLVLRSANRRRQRDHLNAPKNAPKNCDKSENNTHSCDAADEPDWFYSPLTYLESYWLKPELLTTVVLDLELEPHQGAFDINLLRKLFRRRILADPRYRKFSCILSTCGIFRFWSWHFWVYRGFCEPLKRDEQDSPTTTTKPNNTTSEAKANAKTTTTTTGDDKPGIAPSSSSPGPDIAQGADSISALRAARPASSCSENESRQGNTREQAPASHSSNDNNTRTKASHPSRAGELMAPRISSPSDCSISTQSSEPPGQRVHLDAGPVDHPECRRHHSARAPLCKDNEYRYNDDADDKHEFRLENHIFEETLMRLKGGDTDSPLTNRLLRRHVHCLATSPSHRLAWSRPLWEMRLVRGPAAQRRASVIFRCQQSLADGKTLLEILAKCLQAPDDEETRCSGHPSNCVSSSLDRELEFKTSAAADPEVPETALSPDRASELRKLASIAERRLQPLAESRSFVSRVKPSSGFRSAILVGPLTMLLWLIWCFSRRKNNHLNRRKSASSSSEKLINNTSDNCGSKPGKSPDLGKLSTGPARLHWKSYSLTRFHQITQMTRSTCSDIILCALSGALRNYLRRQNCVHNPPNLDVSLSVDMGESGPRQGNVKMTQVNVPIPVSVEGVVPRLWELRNTMDELRHSADPWVMLGFKRMLHLLLPTKLFQWLVNRLTLRNSSIFVNNLRGPQTLVESWCINLFQKAIEEAQQTPRIYCSSHDDDLARLESQKPELVEAQERERELQLARLRSRVASEGRGLKLRLAGNLAIIRSIYYLVEPPSRDIPISFNCITYHDRLFVCANSNSILVENSRVLLRLFFQQLDQLANTIAKRRSLIAIVRRPIAIPAESKSQKQQQHEQEGNCAPLEASSWRRSAEKRLKLMVNSGDEYAYEEPADEAPDDEDQVLWLDVVSSRARLQQEAALAFATVSGAAAAGGGSEAPSVATRATLGAADTACDNGMSQTRVAACQAAPTSKDDLEAGIGMAIKCSFCGHSVCICGRRKSLFTSGGRGRESDPSARPPPASDSYNANRKAGPNKQHNFMASLGAWLPAQLSRLSSADHHPVSLLSGGGGTSSNANKHKDNNNIGIAIGTDIDIERGQSRASDRSPVPSAVDQGKPSHALDGNNYLIMARQQQQHERNITKNGHSFECKQKLLEELDHDDDDDDGQLDVESENDERGPTITNRLSCVHLDHLGRVDATCGRLTDSCETMAATGASKLSSVKFSSVQTMASNSQLDNNNNHNGKQSTRTTESNNNNNNNINIVSNSMNNNIHINNHAANGDRDYDDGHRHHHNKNAKFGRRPHPARSNTELISLGPNINGRCDVKSRARFIAQSSYDHSEYLVRAKDAGGALEGQGLKREGELAVNNNKKNNGPQQRPKMKLFPLKKQNSDRANIPPENLGGLNKHNGERDISSSEDEDEDANALQPNYHQGQRDNSTTQQRTNLDGVSDLSGKLLSMNYKQQMNPSHSGTSSPLTPPDNGPRYQDALHDTSRSLQSLTTNYHSQQPLHTRSEFNLQSGPIQLDAMSNSSRKIKQTSQQSLGGTLSGILLNKTNSGDIKNPKCNQNKADSSQRDGKTSPQRQQSWFTHIVPRRNQKSSRNNVSASSSVVLVERDRARESSHESTFLDNRRARLTNRLKHHRASISFAPTPGSPSSRSTSRSPSPTSRTSRFTSSNARAKYNKSDSNVNLLNDGSNVIEVVHIHDPSLAHNSAGRSGKGSKFSLRRQSLAALTGISNDAMRASVFIKDEINADVSLRYNLINGLPLKQPKRSRRYSTAVGVNPNASNQRRRRSLLPFGLMHNQAIPKSFLDTEADV